MVCLLVGKRQRERQKETQKERERERERQRERESDVMLARESMAMKIFIKREFIYIESVCALPDILKKMISDA